MGWIDQSNGQYHQGGPSGPNCGRGSNATGWVYVHEASDSKPAAQPLWSPPESRANMLNVGDPPRDRSNGFAFGRQDGIPAGFSRGLDGYRGAGKHVDPASITYPKGWEPTAWMPGETRRIVIAVVAVAAIAACFGVPLMSAAATRVGDSLTDYFDALPDRKESLDARIVMGIATFMHGSARKHLGKREFLNDVQRDDIIAADAGVAKNVPDTEAGRKRFHQQVMVEENSWIVYARDRMPELVKPENPLMRNLTAATAPYKAFVNDNAQELARRVGASRVLSTSVGQQARELHARIEDAEWALRVAVGDAEHPLDKLDFSKRSRRYYERHPDARQNTQAIR